MTLEVSLLASKKKIVDSATHSIQVTQKIFQHFPHRTVAVGEPDRPSLLLKASVSTVPLTDCNRTLTDYNRLSNQPSLRALTVSQMCALNPLDNSDACQGDSGGPLFVTDHSGVSTLLGVISFGVSCGSHLPGVYTRVAAYTEWIESVVWPTFGDFDRVYL